MNNVSPRAIGEAQFQACQLVDDFLQARVRPRVQAAVAAHPNGDAATFAGILWRVIAWVHTLAKLNEATDFQASIAASRALFEIAVDVTILHFDEDQSVPKLIAWEDSSKLKSAMRIRDYFLCRNEAPTREFDGPMQFLDTGGARVQALRAHYWNGQHPSNRWTGRSLEQDACQASRMFEAGDYEQFYETRYPQICWNTHGSGLAGVRFISVENLPGLSGIALSECAHFALVAAEIILLHLELWDAPMAVEFDDHRAHRIALTHATMTGHSPA